MNKLTSGPTLLILGPIFIMIVMLEAGTTLIKVRREQHKLRAQCETLARNTELYFHNPIRDTEVRMQCITPRKSRL